MITMTVLIDFHRKTYIQSITIIIANHNGYLVHRSDGGRIQEQNKAVKTNGNLLCFCVNNLPNNEKKKKKKTLQHRYLNGNMKADHDSLRFDTFWRNASRYDTNKRRFPPPPHPPLIATPSTSPIPSIKPIPILMKRETRSSKRKHPPLH